MSSYLPFFCFSPLGKKLRSKVEVMKYCEKNKLDVDMDMIVFKTPRVGSSTPKGQPRPSKADSTTPASEGKTPKSVPTTPKTPKVPKSPKAVKTPKSPKAPKSPKSEPSKKRKVADKSQGKELETNVKSQGEKGDQETKAEGKGKKMTIEAKTKGKGNTVKLKGKAKGQGKKVDVATKRKSQEEKPPAHIAKRSGTSYQPKGAVKLRVKFPFSRKRGVEDSTKGGPPSKRLRR